MSDTPQRLDSWKAIADYLNRDVRTLRRWEAQGLPVRRVAGGRGNSVYAFREEIDAWLRARPEEPPLAAPAAPVTVVAPAAAIAPPVATAAVVPPMSVEKVRPPRSIWRSRYFVATAIVVVVLIGWKVIAPFAEQHLNVELSERGITASDQSGKQQWRYDFAAGARNIPSEIGPRVQQVGGARPGVFAMTAFLLREPDLVPMNGVLRLLTNDGRLEHEFSFDDFREFGERDLSSPWALTDFAVLDAYGQRYIAVSAHHFTWWGGLVTVLDERFQRLGTFVNSGWVESLRWASPDRLAIAGFSERLDGGMLAILDAHDIDGVSPEPTGSKFACRNCGAGHPLVYFVFPRSEVNRVSSAPFNRAKIEPQERGVVARTYEVAPDKSGGVPEAIYELSPTFELQRATYGSRYWDKHRALEMEGKINHTREQCPERDGPPLVKMWTRETGWTEIRPKR